MSNYTINDSIFKLLFAAVGVAVHNMRVRHAKRRLEKAFDKAIKLSGKPNSTTGNLFWINEVYYFRTCSEKIADEIKGAIAMRDFISSYLDSVADMLKSKVERNENED